MSDLPTQPGTLRLDIWLHRTRLFKTRSGASKAVASGRVRVTRAGRTERVLKPHYKLAVGDAVSFVRPAARETGSLVSVTVVGIPGRRGPFEEARQCYIEAEEG